LSVAWEDTGTPFWHGLRVGSLPHPYEVFDICAGLPHGKYGTGKAQQMLGWQPQYNFEQLYRRPQ
jgi:hypothetical protein